MHQADWDAFHTTEVQSALPYPYVDQTITPLKELGARELLTGERALTAEVTAIPAPGKMALHLEGRRAPSPEDNVGFVIRPGSTGGIAYFSGVAGPSPEVERAIVEADLVFFDGTFWSSDELIAAGLGTRTAEQMAHWPIGGPTGSLGFLAGSRTSGVRIYIHVNNTNPILHEDSPQRRAVEDAGLHLAYDGMAFDL